MPFIFTPKLLPNGAEQSLPPLQPHQSHPLPPIPLPLSGSIVQDHLRIEMLFQQSEEPLVRLIHHLDQPIVKTSALKRTFRRFFQQNRISTSLPRGARSHTVFTRRGKAGYTVSGAEVRDRMGDTPRSTHSLLRG